MGECLSLGLYRGSQREQRWVGLWSFSVFTLFTAGTGLRVEIVTGFLCGVQGILKGRPQRDSSCSICSAAIPLHWVMLCDVFRTMCPGTLRDYLSFCPEIWLWQILLHLLHPPGDIFLGLRLKSCSQVFSNSATAQSCAMNHQLNLAWRKDSFFLF